MHDDFNAWIDHNTRAIRADRRQRALTWAAWTLIALGAGVLATLAVSVLLARV